MNSTEISISEEIFSKFISENFDCDLFNAPNSSWKYVKTDFQGDGRDFFESYIFTKNISGKLKFKKINLIVPKGKRAKFTLDIKLSKKDLLDFVYKYKKLFFNDYTKAKCKEEYGDEQFSFYIEGVSPFLDVKLPVISELCSLTFYTSFCNKSYIDIQKSKGKILTLQK